MLALVMVVVVGAVGAVACGDDPPAPKPPRFRTLDEPIKPLPAPVPAAGGFNVLQTFNRPGAAVSPVRAMIEDITREVAGDLNLDFTLPRTVYVTGQVCGEANAFYAPDTHQIVFCDEFAAHLESLFAGYTDERLRNQATEAAIVFFFLHEVGHALLGELGIRDIGSQEDTADTIATYLMIAMGEAELAIHAADSFLYMARAEAASNVPFAFWDKHGLSEQRFYSVLCLLYGSDPNKFAAFVESGMLPAETSLTCQRQWTDDSTAIVEKLAPHRRVKLTPLRR
jgi:hypothetical protein